MKKPESGNPNQRGKYLTGIKIINNKNKKQLCKVRMIIRSKSPTSPMTIIKYRKANLIQKIIKMIMKIMIIFFDLLSLI